MQRMTDIQRLMEIHGDVGGRAVGRRVGVEVLNRSAIVLLTAIWEGYVEDVSAEAVEHLVNHLSDASHLPLSLRKKVAAEFRENPNQVAVWSLAGDSWKSVLRARLTTYAAENAQRLNTPMSERVDTLLDGVVGIPQVTDAWHWSHMSRARARGKLDSLVRLRGDIAHGSGAKRPVQKGDVTGWRNHVGRLVEKTDDRVNAHVTHVTGVALF